MSVVPSLLRIAALGACIGCSAAPAPAAKQESQFKPLASASASPQSACEQELTDLHAILDSQAVSAPGSCPPGTRQRGRKCEEIEIVCPPGSTRVGTACVGEVLCPDKTVWNGLGCVAAPSPPPGAPAGAPAAGAPAGAPAVTPAGNSCVLRLNSIPTSVAFVDGVLVGLTPVLNRLAPAGTHVITFVQEEVGKKVLTVSCKAGETKVVVAKF